MTKLHRLSLSLFLFTACGDDPKPAQPDAPTPPPIDAAIDPPPPEWTPAEQAVLDTLGPLPAVPADPTNAFADNANAAALGQMLFFDKSYSGALVVGDDATNHGLGQVGETGKVSCASCHGAGGAALDDQRSLPNNVSLGTNYGTRNAHGMVNSSYYKWSNWGGRFDSQWSLPLAVAEGGATMKSTRLAIAHTLYAKYRTEYDAIFPVPLDARLDPTNANAFPATGKPGDAAFDALPVDDQKIINRIYANYGKALAAYTRTLTSKNSPFDRYRAGDPTAISASAKRGLHAFIAKCAQCHDGPNFSDDEFHNIGVTQSGPNVPPTDNGRFQDIPLLLGFAFNSNSEYSDDVNTGRLTGVAQSDDQKGAFRTKSLRGVATSAPYMHAGQMATLAEVVEFYNTSMSLGFDATTKADLVAFMETLTGEPVPAMRLADTSK